MDIPFGFRIAMYVALSCVNLYVLIVLLKMFFGYKSNINRLIRACIYLIYMILGIVTYFTNIIPVINVIIGFMLNILVAIFFFNGRLRKKIIVSIFFLLFSTTIETIICLISIWAFGVAIDAFVYSDTLTLIGSTIYSIFSIIIIMCINYYYTKRDNLEKFNLIDSIDVIILPICSIGIILVFMNLLMKSYISGEKILIFTLIFMIFINLLFYFFMGRLKELEKIKYDNELLRSKSEYYVELERNINSTFERIRIIKHDLSYHLLFLKAKIENHDEKSFLEAKDKINSLVNDALKDEFKIFTKNFKLNTVLNYKLFEIDNWNINANVNVSILENAIIDEGSLYVILGNAIDNVINYFKETDLAEKNLYIKIFDDVNNLYIKISNSFFGNLKFKNGLPITTNKDKANHGIGLKSIKKLVDDKEGYFKVSVMDNVFSLEILLYDEIKYK